jgi:hypothetical protein
MSHNRIVQIPGGESTENKCHCCHFMMALQVKTGRLSRLRPVTKTRQPAVERIGQAKSQPAGLCRISSCHSLTAAAGSSPVAVIKYLLLSYSYMIFIGGASQTLTASDFCQ